VTESETGQKRGTKENIFSALTEFEFGCLNSWVYYTNTSEQRNGVYSQLVFSHEALLLALFVPYSGCLESGSWWHP